MLHAMQPMSRARTLRNKSALQVGACNINLMQLTIIIFLFRVRAAGYSLIRAPTNIGRYVMLTKDHIRAEPGKGR